MADVNVEWSDYSDEEERFTEVNDSVRPWDYSRIFESDMGAGDEDFWAVDEEQFPADGSCRPTTSSSRAEQSFVDDYIDPLDSISPNDNYIPSLSDELLCILKELDELEPPVWNFTSS